MLGGVEILLRHSDPCGGHLARRAENHEGIAACFLRWGGGVERVRGGV